MIGVVLVATKEKASSIGMGPSELMIAPFRKPSASKVLYTLYSMGKFADVHPVSTIVNGSPTKPSRGETVTFPPTGEPFKSHKGNIDIAFLKDTIPDRFQ